MDSENINEFFPESDETQKGHVRQILQGVGSTKVAEKDVTLTFIKMKDVYVQVSNQSKRQRQLHQTGKFLITSMGGSKYIMVAGELDRNYINAEPIKSGTTTNIKEAYLSIYNSRKATRVIGFVRIGASLITKHTKNSRIQYVRMDVELN